jgi:cbb3-type cytochrome oxidase maturation protein
MTGFFYLIPVALVMGAAGLGAFLWSLRSGQYEDLDGAAERILFDEDDVPATAKPDSLNETIDHAVPLGQRRQT